MNEQQRVAATCALSAELLSTTVEEAKAAGLSPFDAWAAMTGALVKLTGALASMQGDKAAEAIAAMRNGINQSLDQLQTTAAPPVNIAAVFPPRSTSRH